MSLQICLIGIIVIFLVNIAKVATFKGHNQAGFARRNPFKNNVCLYKYMHKFLEVHANVYTKI